MFGENPRLGATFVLYFFKIKRKNNILKIKEEEKMLAASFCRELHFTVLPPTINSRVPRCLFGSPSSKETMDLLQDALDIERTRFASKWGVDPRSENDKENILPRFEKVERSPRKRCSPYSKQTNIHGKFYFS